MSWSCRLTTSVPIAILLVIMCAVTAVVSENRPEDALIVVGSTPFDDRGVPVSTSLILTSIH